MIRELDAAYAWYRGAKRSTEILRRLGEKYWGDLPWEGPLSGDEVLREIQSTEVTELSSTVLEDLDDLAVLLLFSVFEAIVRQRTLDLIEAELQPPRHPASKHIVKDLNRRIERGGFPQFLEAYNGVGRDLVGEVRQVLHYRNWVAHGKREEQPAVVTPDDAFPRLRQFLDRMAELDAPPG